MRHALIIHPSFFIIHYSLSKKEIEIYLKNGIYPLIENYFGSKSDCEIVLDWLQREHPDVQIYTTSIDERLNEIIYKVKDSKKSLDIFTKSFIVFNNLLDIFKIWEGGLAIHGGIIAGIIFIFFYTRKHDISLLGILDVFAPALVLGQAIGRWGNFMNNEAYGPITSLEFLKNLHLPKFIIDGMFIDGNYHHPTFLYESFFNLIYFSSKITYYIAICLTIPIIFYIEPILNLWLGQIPENSPIFIRIILIQIIIRSFHEPIDLIFKSSGNIKQYQIISIIISIIGLIVIYFVMKNGTPIYAVFVGLCIMELIEYISILLLSQKEGLSIYSYLKKVTIPTSIVSIIILLLSYLTYIYIPSNLFIIGLIIIGIACITSIVFVGFTPKERKSIYSLIRKK